MYPNKKLALVHHWLVGMRGGEKVLEEFCRLFPTSKIYCLVADRNQLSPLLQSREIVSSLLSWIPKNSSLYKLLLPLHPFFIRNFHVEKDSEIVLCSDASMIKGLHIPEDATLICYCHSPPRYIWEMSESYKKHSSGLGAFGRYVFEKSIPGCRNFDYQASKRVNQFIANSNFVRDRIMKYYQQPSVVVYPPVDVDSFVHTRPRREFYLVVSELVPYKRIDLAVDAFNELGLPLVVIGDGSERKRLQSMAKSNITFLGRQDFSVVKEHYETCKAFIFPGVEDFGITPLEAQASGSPVIALGKGGALETVIDNETGFFFPEQSVESLKTAIQNFATNSVSINPYACRANAIKFRPEVFRERILEVINSLSGIDKFGEAIFEDQPARQTNSSSRLASACAPSQ